MIALNPSQKTALALIAAAAEHSLPCPSNDAIAGACGFSSSSRASLLIANLERAGLIRVERFQNSRVVTIAATGETTAGVFHRPHVKRGEGAEEEPQAASTLRRSPVRRRGRTVHNTGHGAHEWEDAAARIVHRDPCALCGVRGDLHGELGCGSLVERVAVGGLV